MRAVRPNAQIEVEVIDLDNLDYAKERKRKVNRLEARSTHPSNLAMKEHPMKAIRRAGVPLVAYITADPEQTVLGCMKVGLGKADDIPLLEWDCARGLRGRNPAGQEAARDLTPDGEVTNTLNPMECLTLLPKAPDESVVFFHNPHRLLESPAAGGQIAQAIWNLRDTFKSKHCTLVMLCPDIILPAEVRNDVITVEEETPTPEDIDRIVTKTAEEAKVALNGEKAKAIDTLLGYQSEFGVEQSFALALTKKGVDLDKLWELKVRDIRKAAGLEVMLPKENFDDLAGCEGVKTFMRLLINGRERPRAVFMLDEIEKMVGGAAGDTSGVSQGLMEQFLYWTEIKKVLGILLVGVPGAGKTATNRCTAGEARVPLLRGSMSTVKGSLVGQSEGQFKALLKCVDAVGQGRVLMIATCNSLDALSPELMARFKLATFFFDYPDETERAALWQLYMKKYELTGTSPRSPNWVGREIESCCHRAWLFNVSMDEASKSVVPISVANADKMDALRRKVSGRFLSAARPGVYVYGEEPVKTASKSRRIDLN
ncbi:MAG TPA: AAA family ATPase [Verrucomicrobiae bacterium]|nr:AAA family ATPase [Verrucomicrobiae bacterium]